eukprot:790109-Prorocentrum_minimum.AAC.2
MIAACLTCPLDWWLTKLTRGQRRASQLARVGSTGPKALSFRHAQCPMRISAASPIRSASRRTVTTYAAAATADDKVREQTLAGTPRH